MVKPKKVYCEETIVYMLKNKDALRQSYTEREIRLIQELETYTETIEGISGKGKELKEFIISKTNAPYDPLFNTLERVEHERKNMIAEQINGLKEVAIKRRELEVLLSEFEKLEEPYKGVLKMLYVEEMSWDEVIHISKKSRGTCCKNRKIGLEMLAKRAGGRIS